MWWLRVGLIYLPAFRITRSWVTGHFDSFTDTTPRAYRDCKKQWVSNEFPFCCDDWWYGCHMFILASNWKVFWFLTACMGIAIGYEWFTWVELLPVLCLAHR